MTRNNKSTRLIDEDLSAEEPKIIESNIGFNWKTALPAAGFLGMLGASVFLFGRQYNRQAGDQGKGKDYGKSKRSD